MTCQVEVLCAPEPCAYESCACHLAEAAESNRMLARGIRPRQVQRKMLDLSAAYGAALLREE